jgi:hypothetical protein
LLQLYKKGNNVWKRIYYVKGHAYFMNFKTLCVFFQLYAIVPPTLQHMFAK